MAKKYIDAEILNKLLLEERNFDRSRAYDVHECDLIASIYENARQIAEDVQAADVQEIRHGKWEQENEIFKCSECAYAFENEGYQHFFNYCPNCGARMDGE